MSSGSKGRYQSRLFNFFHKQSRRFNERFGRSLRQLQVATSWSLEALSKSIYLLLQKAIDSAGTQLSAAAESSHLQLQASVSPLASDTAIVRVIENVENTKKNNQISGEFTSKKIQGIASQLYSKSLVFVTSENEIIDVLTPSQQKALENKIITEVANYWCSWRLSPRKQERKLLSRVNGLVKRLLPSNIDRTKALTPGDTVVKREYKHLQINPRTLASLDIAVAKLETNALAPVSRAQLVLRQRGGEIIKVVKTQFNIFLYGDKQSVSKTAYPQVTVSKKQVVSDSYLETQKLKIKALISAALNYFYGNPQDKKLKQTPPTRYFSATKSKASQLQCEQSKDDWLTLDDLTGSTRLNPSIGVENPEQKLFGGFQIPNWRTLQLKEKAGLQKPQKSTSKLQNQNRKEITQTQTRESTQVEAKPEWIETKAEIVGYQKHPLEQILAWIDSAMLKVEQVFIKVANALGQLWRK
ncbi:MAG: hypothetical protein ACFB2X_12655 [Rivularia sp. (in: cyanobacteria)]